MLSLQYSTIFYVSIVLIIVTGSVRSESLEITGGLVGQPGISATVIGEITINENKQIHSTVVITPEDANIVLSRLKQISSRTSSNIHKLLALQKEEFKNNPKYEDGWNRAKAVYYAGKKQTLTDRSGGGVPDEYHIALIAYSTRILFNDFNTATRNIRSEASIDSYPWKSYFKLLLLAVEELGSNVQEWKPSNFQVLYRGAKTKFNLTVDQTLAFQQFTSSSTSLATGRKYAEGVTLFEFHNVSATTAMSLMDHSVSEYEKEVLFSPSQTFRVIEVRPGSPDIFILSSSVLVYGNCLLVVQMAFFVSVANLW